MRQKEKKIEKKPHSDSCNNIKHLNTYVIEVPEGKQ